MPATFPSAVKSFTPIVDSVDYPQADDLNQAYDEITAVETALINGFAIDVLPDASGTRSLGSAAKTWLDLFIGVIKAALGSATAPSHSFVGDLNTGMYSSGADAVDFTTAGVKALGIDSTQFIDSPTQPRAVVYNSAAQSLADATETTISFDTEDLDVGALHAGGAPTRLTVPTGGNGYYRVTGVVAYAAHTTGYRYSAIRLNGTTELERRSHNNAGGSSPTTFEVTWEGALVATDYVELRGFQNSTGALDTGSATRSLANSFRMVKLW